MKKLLLLFTLALSAIIGKATHITHGNVYYEYLGKDANNDNRYKISIIIYRDCQTVDVSFDESIELGVYRKNKSLFISAPVFLTDTAVVSPFSLSNNTGNFCFRKGRYITVISLPPDTAGYHVVWHRCCRKDITNITDNNSSAYYAFISAETNSSPVTNFDGIISVNAGKWYNISAGSTDKDGDTLTYTLTTPLNGQAGTSNPAPHAFSTITFPVPLIKYKSGFTAQKPLGTTGEFIVYAKSGNFRVFSGTQGVYIIGVKISEWRNGVLLAEHYREISLYCSGTLPGNAVYLTGQPGTGNEIALNWGYSVDLPVKQLVLRRRTEHDTTWQTSAVYDSTGFAYTDTAIETDSLYWYQVTANTDFTSVKSNIIKISLKPVKPAGVNTYTKPEFTAYPNPVNDRLFINDEKSNISTIIISDISGRILYETADMEEIKTKGLHISFLPAGIYVLQAATPDGLQTLRVIKQ